MKDGRTHLAYKAEHAVDLESEAIVATTVTFADRSDPQSGSVTLSLAEANLVLAGRVTEIETLRENLQKHRQRNEGAGSLDEGEPVGMVA